MSGSSSSSSQRSKPQLNPQQLIDLYNKNLPNIFATSTGQINPTNTSLASSAAGANPIYTAAGLSQLQQYAPGYQQAGIDMASKQAAADAALQTGTGANLARSLSGLNDELNPLQKQTETRSSDLLNSINLNGLSGGETAAVERSLNQSNTATGNLGLDNATNAVSNAMNFGNALQAKREALGSAIGTASGVAQARNSMFNPVNVAMGVNGSVGNNFGLGTFNPTQANSTVTAPLNFASSMFSPIASNASASNSRGNSSAVSGGLCWITTAVCKFLGKPDNCEELTILRNFRNRLPKSLVEDYYKLAPIIEPKLNRADLDYCYRMIQSCIDKIKHCDSIAALEMYLSLVNKLKGKYCV